MGFWTSDITHTPAMEQLFMVKVGSTSLTGVEGTAYIWFAKSVDKPSITYNRSSGLDGKRIFNQRADFKPVALDSVPTLNDITLTLIDPSYPSVAKQIMQILNQGGMAHKNGYGYNRYIASNYLEPFIITQFTHKKDDYELTPLQQWKLDEPVIIDVNFGSLDYSSDKFVDIKLKIAYSGFTLSTPEDDTLNVRPELDSITNSLLANSVSNSKDYTSEYSSQAESLFNKTDEQKIKNKQ